jgi:5-methyltetrahydropteroyltriglutamate--homocysteine methyltransferase
MRRSSERFLTTHAGGLPVPDDLRDLLAAKDSGRAYDQDALARRVTTAVAEVVQQQVHSGVDVVNDGEFSKYSWAAYFGGRLSGTDRRDVPQPVSITRREMRRFPEWFAIAGPGGFSGVQRLAAMRAGSEASIGAVRRWTFCTGPLKYTGQDEVQTDIANLKAAAQHVEVEELFLSALAPATAGYFITNEYYRSDDDLVFALAEAMHEEYKAITDAGLVLQLDEPAIATCWQTYPDLTLQEFRRWIEIRVEALNNALAGIPQDRVRLHICWGSSHHPHSQDLPLREVIDLFLKVNAGAYSLEASNPLHDHDWEVWKTAGLPEGKILIPGVIGHFTDYIENPELVAERLAKYAEVAGRENVIAGTDCGIGTRVGHPSICWAKFESMAQGARMATERLSAKGSVGLK